MTRTILRRKDGGEFSRIVGAHYLFRWEAIAEAVAREFECRSEDVELFEDDDGVECLTVKGEIVGFIDDGFGLIPLYHMQEAAE